MFVSKPLRNVKNGKMDRRQLIKGVAITATGAFVASLAPGTAPAFAQTQTAKPKKGLQAVCWQHISRSGVDVVKSRDFFTDLFAMECTWFTTETSGCAVTFGEQAALNDGEWNNIYIRKFNPKVGHPSLDHMAFGIEHFDLDKTAAIIKSLGYTPTYDGLVMWTVKGPDGWVAQPTALVGGWPGPSGITAGGTIYFGYKGLPFSPPPLAALLKFPGHALRAIGAVVSLKVTDVAKTRDFYTSLLGLKVSAEKPGACFLRFGRYNGLLLGKSDKGDNLTYSDHLTIIVADYKPENLEEELARRNLNAQKDPQAPAYTFVDLDGLTNKVAGTEILEGKMGLAT